MSEPTRPGPAAPAGDGPAAGDMVPLAEELDEAECLRLVAGQDVGRIAFTGRFGLTVFPVNYRFFEGSIVFRTGEHSALDEDLRTGIANAEYKVAFEVDETDRRVREGWSVLIQGSAHHVASPQERAAVEQTDVSPWAGGSKELFMRIVPTRITGRRIRRTRPPASGHSG